MAETKQDDRPGRYDFTKIEARWQRYWDENQTFRTANPGEPGFEPGKPKYYILDMFPYPSGAGLHVGHPLGYCATDIIARYKRMCGFNVLHPMGFDAFGLPAEQYAIETNVHPAQTTKKNIEMYRRQLRMFGFSYDWDREVATCDPSYYKFTQWMFVRMFESWYDDECRWSDTEGVEQIGRARPIAELVDSLESGAWGVDEQMELVRESEAPGRREWSDLTKAEQREAVNRRRLAFVDEIPVNWCPQLGTVLANEEVTNEGRSDRGDHPVYRRPLRQWMLRITKYADRLLTDLKDVDWPEPIRLMQRNWIGKSTGAEVVFPLAEHWTIENGQWRPADPSQPSGTALSYASFPNAIRVYTTRPDTLFGATYMVLAPEHALVEQITTPDRRGEVERYVETARHRSELDRTADNKEKTGVFTGAYAINPVNGQRIPIWIADYVLMGYGTGAIMSVPGGDTRDFEFAKKFKLPIIAVVTPSVEWIEWYLNEYSAAPFFADVVGRSPEEVRSDLESQEVAQREQVGAYVRKEYANLVKQYVQSPAGAQEPFTGDGECVNSPGAHETDDVPGGVCTLDSLSTPDAKAKIINWLERNGTGRGAVNFKLRDWVFSRQKYWGEPFPVLHGEDGETIAVGDDDLPVELPEMEDFKPTPAADNAESVPEPPLGRAKEWVRVERDGKQYRRDLNTMPQWAGSCWYYLRFIDPHNTEHFCDPEAERYWMPIDLYLGGAEHAVLHLLYARFWHKVMYDLGHVSTPEPFRKLFNQGKIQSFAFRDKKRGVTVGPDGVEEKKVSGRVSLFISGTDDPAERVIAKMSKSLKNVVSPDGIVEKYGADTFRMYEMYMGPLEADKPWSTRDVPGLHKLCQRIWRLVIDERTDELTTALVDAEPDENALRAQHKLVKRVTEDLEQLKFNTAIAAVFDFVNTMTTAQRRPRSVLETFLKVLAPFAPHLAEELWCRLGRSQTLAYEPWPTFDEKLARDDEVEIAVQVRGKIKARVMVAVDADEDATRSVALADPKVVAAIGENPIRKVIVVKGRLVNVIV